MKVAALTLTFLTFVSLSFFCKCPEPLHHWILTGITVKAYTDTSFHYHELDTNDVVHLDTLDMYVDYGGKLSASNTNCGNSATASKKCPLGGDAGLINHVDSMVIESDVSYEGLLPGTNLNNFVLVIDGHRISPTYTGYSVDSLVKQINKSPRYGLPSTTLVFSTNPHDSLTRKFIVKVKLSNHQVYKAETVPFKWE